MKDYTKAVRVYQAACDERYIASVLESGTIEDLEEIEQLVPGFPAGKTARGQPWINIGICVASKLAVQWMISRKVDLSFAYAGYGLLHTVLERKDSMEKYEILELLLKNGAPINERGFNDWTPAHMAAARNDLNSLKMLVRYGADLSIRTRIDDHATVLEEACHLQKIGFVKSHIVEYLKTFD
jgi:hypothetical protein